MKPKSGAFERYLEIAASLKPKLERMEGFIGNWRFSNRTRPGFYLSLSLWRDEKSLTRWRVLAPHHGAQSLGRAEIFEDYRIRVGEVVFDNEMRELPQQRSDETEISPAKALTISETADEEAVKSRPGIVDCEIFESLTEPRHKILVVSWHDAGAAASWRPARFRHRQVRIIRDYGLRDRREAPQFFPEGA